MFPSTNSCLALAAYQNHDEAFDPTDCPSEIILIFYETLSAINVAIYIFLVIYALSASENLKLVNNIAIIAKKTRKDKNQQTNDKQ